MKITSTTITPDPERTEYAVVDHQSPVWREKDDLLHSVPGVGQQLSLSLLAYLPELGALNRKRIAALVDVAPFDRDSGQVGANAAYGRQIPVASRALHGCAGRQSMQPGNPSLLSASAGGGEAEKLALTACRRKLLTILNAMAKSGQHWTPRVTST